MMQLVGGGGGGGERQEEGGHRALFELNSALVPNIVNRDL